MAELIIKNITSFDRLKHEEEEVKLVAQNTKTIKEKG